MVNNNKYKDNTTEQTIKNIEKFFKDHNYYIKQTLDGQATDSGTYWCRLELYTNDDILVLGTNGKGVTKEYSLASGYGELFERYCAHNIIFSNFFTGKDILQAHYDKYGYYYGEDEVILEEDSLNQNELYKAFLGDFFGDDVKKRHKYLKAVSPFGLYAVPYASLTENNKKMYVNIPLNVRVQGSNGFSAGNSIEEALVQGASEVIERYSMYTIDMRDYDNYSHNIDKNKPKGDYKQLDINSISINEDNKQIIEKIINAGNKLYIYDLSYTLNLPTVMIVVYNTNTSNFHTHYGSHPVFNIALERCLTETYQGIFTLNNAFRAISPFKSINTKKAFLEAAKSGSTEIGFNDKVMTDFSIVNKVNEEIFLIDGNYSNNELLDRMRMILNKNKMELYWRKTSKADDYHIYGVHCFLKDIEIPLNGSWMLYDIDNLKILETFSTMIIIYYNFINDIRNGNIKTNLKWYNVLFANYSDPEENHKTFKDLNYFDYMNVYCAKGQQPILEGILGMFNNYFNDNYITSEPYSKLYKYYLNIKKYYYADYPIEEIKKLFAPFGHDIDKDLENIDNIPYLIENIIIKPYLELINSKEYKNFVEYYSTTF